MVRRVWQMVGAPTDEAPHGYPDVPAGAGYSPAVDWAPSAQPHQPARRWVEGKGWVDGDAEEAPQWVPGVGYVGDDPTGGTP